MVSDRIASHCRNEAPLRRLAIAGRTDPPARATFKFRCIYAQEPKPLRAAAEGVTIDDISARAVQHLLFVAGAVNVRNGQ